jgi:glycerol-3-phosphate dehydrogenase subunit C
MLSSGEWRPVPDRARNIVDTLAPIAETAEAIVASSTSCGLTLRRKYAAYLDMQDEAAQRVSSATTDICSFLRDTMSAALQSELKPIRARALYHGPCQLRGHQAGWPAIELLCRIDGLEIEISRASCCGTAGTYGYDRDKREIAETVAQPLMEQIRVSRPDFVICDSETCRWHISAETHLPAFHPVEVLLASIDGKRPQE